MNANRPVWLLDVDGVINCKSPRWRDDEITYRVMVDGQRYRMRWAPELINNIRILHTSGAVDIRWCSTWCAYADRLERLWQLPPLGRAFDEHMSGRHTAMAKLTAAKQVLADGHRLIWTDDTETPREGSKLHTELTKDGRSLLIVPDECYGLRSAHIDTIKTFINARR